MSKNEDEAPLGGVFILIGMVVGVLYGYSFGGLLGAFIGFFIGGALGQFVENLVFRLIMFALAVLWFLIRAAFWQGVSDGINSSITQPDSTPELVAFLPQDFFIFTAEITHHLGLIS